MTLGRDPKNSLVFEQGDVSRRHAEIIEKDGKHYLRDLGSSYGTFLNGTRLEQGRWFEFSRGDALRLGGQACLSRSPNDLAEQIPTLPLPRAGEALTVGRSPENNLVAPWSDASRSHALIQHKDGKNWILDRGSSFGTFLNGKKIPSQQWVTLQPGNVVQFGVSPQGAFQVPQPDRTTSLQKLSPVEAQMVLARAEFAPNPIGMRGLGAADCSQEFLAAQGLGPETTFRCGEQKIHLSRPYNLGEDRAACVGYVEDGSGKVQVRAFYRSNSQGLWRSASHCGFGGWIGKGQGEESTNLPIPLQKFLQNQAESGLLALSEAATNQAFFGALEFGGNSAPGDLQSQLKPPRELGSFGSLLPNPKYGQPETFLPSQKSDMPDFSKISDDYSFQHPVHGQIQARVFPSHNGQLNYLYYQDTHNRTWIAQVEQADAPLTSWGTREVSVKLGSLGMPAIEYPVQIPSGYAGPMVNGEYADASAYVHRLPPVAEYRRHMGLT